MGAKVKDGEVGFNRDKESCFHEEEADEACPAGFTAPLVKWSEASHA